VVIRGGTLIFICVGNGIWKRLELEALAKCGQEVDFQDEMSREREWED
jgi:hypothetical protein